MSRQRIEGILLSGHKQHAVEVPFDPAKRWKVAAVALWPGRRGHPVRAQIGRKSFDTAIVARSKRFWLLIEEEIANSLEVSVGDSITVVVDTISKK